MTADEQAAERRLRERVNQRWQALIARDFAKAYEYETPEYRKTHTAKQYAGQFGGMVDWKVATVKEVRYDHDDEVEVVVTVGVSFPLNVGDSTAHATVDVREKWVASAGQWWHLDDPKPLGRAQAAEPSPRE